VARVARDVDVRVAGLTGHGHVVEVVGHVVGRRVIRQDARLDIVLADGSAGADEPEAFTAVGHARTVQIVPVAGGAAVEQLLPAVGGPFEDDAAAAHRIRAVDGVYDIVERLLGRRLDAGPAVGGRDSRRRDCSRGGRRGDRFQYAAPSSRRALAHCVRTDCPGIVKDGKRYTRFDAVFRTVNAN